MSPGTQDFGRSATCRNAAAYRGEGLDSSIAGAVLTIVMPRACGAPRHPLGWVELFRETQPLARERLGLASARPNLQRPSARAMTIGQESCGAFM
jgi:hypothetical protein